VGKFGWPPGPKGPVRFKVPLHALRFLLPALWPQAEADVLVGAA